MRGTPPNAPDVVGGTGIIPAYAGNTPQAERPEPTRRDHPRVCGEHRLSGGFLFFVWGSSPRMRGTLGAVMIYPVLDGIIPAYAGNTFAAMSRSIVSWDHPRVCGEHSPLPPFNAVHLGSSPRMRGTRDN